MNRVPGRTKVPVEVTEALLNQENPWSAGDSLFRLFDNITQPFFSVMVKENPAFRGEPRRNSGQTK